MDGLPGFNDTDSEWAIENDEGLNRNQIVHSSHAIFLSYNSLNSSLRSTNFR